MTTMERTCALIMKLKKSDITPSMLKPEASLADDLGLDSLAMAELLVLAEDEFSIEIPLEDAVKLKTISDAVKYYDELVARKG